MTKTILLALGTALVAASPLAAASPRDDGPAIGDDARIPFVNFRGIRTFHAEGNDVLYLQDQRRNWYRAELMGPCLGLQWALNIGIDNRGSSYFDRFSTVLVDGQRCQVLELTHSAAPERRRSRRNRGS